MTDVAFDAAIGSLTNGWSHTNSNAGNSILVAARDGSGTAVSAVSYGGVSLTKLGFHASNGAEGNGDGITFWGKIGGLPTGANTVTVTGFNSWGGSYTAANPGSFGSIFTLDNTDDSGETSGSITLTGTAVGGIVVAATSFGSSGTPTAGSGATVRWFELANSDSASGNGWLIDKPSAASTTAVGWTNIDQDWWGTVAVEIKPAGGSTPTITGAIRLKKMKLSGTSTEKSVATGAIRLKKMKLSGSSAEKTVVTSAIRLKKMKLSGTSTEKAVITGAIHLKKMVVSASSTEKTVATGTILLKKMVVSASSTEKTVITGAINLKKMIVSASGSVTNPDVPTITGAIHLKKMRLVATSSEKTVITGSISMKKMVLHGSSTEWSVIHVTINMKKMRLHGSSGGGQQVRDDPLFIFSLL